MSYIRKASIEDVLSYGIDFFKIMYEDSGSPVIAAFSPATAYIFGEHSDYCHGYGMGLTIPLITMVLVGFSNKEEICIATDSSCGDKLIKRYPLLNFDSQIKDAPTWAKLILGVANIFKAKFYTGINIAFVSSIPIAFGLGSSTALTSAFYISMECLVQKYHREQTKMNLCREVELKVGNTPTGIIQPMVSFCAEPGYILLTDCGDLTSRYLPFTKNEVVFVITFSGIERVVSETVFRERMDECEMARSLLGLNSLSEVTSRFLSEKKGVISNKLHKRVTHVISEITRVYEATLALERKDWHTFGLMMLKSHVSLRDNFEVVPENVDALVSMTMGCTGVYGSKISGGGSGGCIITLIERTNVAEFIELIDHNYSNECSFLVAYPWGSASECTQQMKILLKKQGDYDVPSRGFPSTSSSYSIPCKKPIENEQFSKDAEEVYKELISKGYNP